MDKFRDSSNDGNTDGSLIGDALSTENGCVLLKGTGETVGYWDGQATRKMLGIVDIIILGTDD